MSSSSRRRHSKWDHRDSEALSENFFEKDPPRKTREPPSPSRGSRRNESHRRERIVPSDREDDNIRPSPGLDELRYRHQSRSPRNDWGRTYRSRSRSRSRSQSQSRSRSPTYNYRREPALTGRSRGKSRGSATICKDFIAGRCRRGTHCFFLHQDAEFDDSPPNNWENKDRKNGSSRYSADDGKEYSVRSERSGNLCNDFAKGRCRRGSSCRFADHEGPMADTFEKGPADVYKDGDSNRRIQDNYPDRNHDRETYRRVATPCRFFAVGNCRNGNHCKFSHQVEENFSPERWSRDDRRGSDRKLDRSPAFDESRWSDSIRVSNVPAGRDWEEDKETLAVNSVRRGDDSWDHGMVEMKQTWDAPSSTYEPKIGDERQTHQWKTENSGGAPIGVDNISGDMAISPRDVSKQQSSSLYAETPALSNVSFPTVQPDTSESPRDKHYHYDFPEPNTSGDAYAGENPNFEDKRKTYTEEGKNNTPNPPMNVQPVQGMFQNDPRANVRPTLSINPPRELKLPLHPSGGDAMQLSPLSPSVNAPSGRRISPGDPRVKFRPTASMNPPAGQVQPLLPLRSSGGDGIQTSHNRPSFFDNNKAADGPPGDQSVDFQPLSSTNPSAVQGGNGMQTSHNPMMFLNNKAVDGPHSGNVNVTQSVSNHSTVSNEQLAQLSHLSISLAQLLESRQQLNLSSASNPSGISSLPDTVPSILSVSSATIQPSQAPEAVKQCDPICDIIVQKMPKLGNQMLPNIVEQKSSDNEQCFENINGENGGKIAEGGSKAPENKLSENIDADEDGKKSKDTKGLRSFKFALADYTKELLKPAWKDGKVNKESYKTIVKKVVDKVIETQGPQIPQTKEKIDQYLSCSKTKLEKLVQAYVGKYKT